MKTSWRRRLANTAWRLLGRRLEDVCKRSWWHFWKTYCKFLKDFLEDEKLLRWRRFQNVLKTSWKTLNVCWEGNDRSQQKLKSDEIGFLPYCFSFSLYSVLIFPILLFVSPVLHCSIPLHLSHGNEENRSIIVSSFKEVFLINNL